MATEQDVRLLEAFVNQTLDTARLVVEQGDIRRVGEREALAAAIHELESIQPQRLIAAYQEAREQREHVLVDAGVVGQQLAAKVEIPRVFVELLRSESEGG